MRIGMPTTSYPADASDASGRFVRQLALALVRRGHTVEVLAPELLISSGDPGDVGIEVKRIAYLRPRVLERTFGLHGAPDNLRLDPLAWPGALAFPIALAATARRRHRAWDAIVSHWAIPSALAVSRVRSDRPHVAVLHGSDVHLACALPRPVREAIVRSATTLSFVSRDLAQRFLHDTRGRADAAVQPMGIDVSETASRDRARARARSGFSRTTVLAMSRLVPIKRIERAIEAVSLLAGIDLVVAGDGPERARLSALASRLGAPVRFVGHLAGEARLDALAGADVFVAPSCAGPDGRTEGTPTAVLEALAAGLPVIASRSGGIADVVAHERTGLLSSGTVEDLARDLARVADDEAFRRELGRNARIAAGAFDVDRVAERFERWLAPRRAQGSTGTALAGTSSTNEAAGMLAG
jgi:glycosyltransferase involved in cell wall biosynthesis